MCARSLASAAGLSASLTVAGDQRLARYRQARDHLLAAGYEQVSMRMFRRANGSAPKTANGTTPQTQYCCQEDGMVGLGRGARSYTSGMHYSFEYAVEIGHVRGIIDSYGQGAARRDQ